MRICKSCRCKLNRMVNWLRFYPVNSSIAEHDTKKISRELKIFMAIFIHSFEFVLHSHSLFFIRRSPHFFCRIVNVKSMLNYWWHRFEYEFQNAWPCGHNSVTLTCTSFAMDGKSQSKCFHFANGFSMEFPFKAIWICSNFKLRCWLWRVDFLSPKRQLFLACLLAYVIFVQ